MDYLRTLGTAAVSSLVQKSGLNLPFSIGPKVASFEGVHTLYDGTKRDDGSPVSIFEYDFVDQSKRNSRPLAKNALRKLRTTRHPDVLKFMDAVEMDTTIYIMTERVRPLEATLPTWSTRSAQEREDWLLWGLHRVSVALAFLNDSCASTHGSICVSSIFISPSGEWKLGGLELLSNSKDEAPVLYTMGGLFPNISNWASPEVKKGGWSVIKESNPGAADAYALGLLLHNVFNPSQPLPATAYPPHPPPSPSSRGSIPAALFVSFKKLLNPNPKARLTPAGFLELGMAETGFFTTNRLVKVCLGLDNFALGSEAEKNTLLRTLKESAASFPPEFVSYRVLPSLVSALEFGGASAASILPLTLQLGKNVSPEEYPTVIIAPLVKLFASPDRGTRMSLLDHLPEFADKLDQKTVSDKIFPHLQTGFSDTVAIIREATVKSIILLAPKLNSRILNNDLLRLLAKTQMDPEASIRTNTCILIGRLGPSLGYNTKRKVLVPAFVRALKDPFVHARVAGLMAFMATIECFEVEELATKVIPNVSPTLIDKEKLVRDQAFKAIELFVGKLESHVATMPETMLSDSSEIPGGFVPGALPTQDTIVNSATGAATALAGWAISSLGRSLATADLQSTMVPISGPIIDRPSSVPPPVGNTLANGSARPSSLTQLHYSPSASSTIPTQSTLSRSARGLQLGSNKLPPSIAVTALTDQWAEEASISDSAGANPWGSGDLIDINADQDDWSAFESAPPAVFEPKPISAVGVGFTGVQAGTSMSPLHRTLSPQARKVVPPAKFSSPSSSRRSTPVASPPSGAGGWAVPDSWDTPEVKTPPTPLTPSIASMSKEDKAAEMARRKEERKQRIALLKEQKKNATRP